MTEQERRGKSRSLVIGAIWVVLLALALSGATYAWISTALKNTNVTPITYNISNEGLDLLIDADPNGQFSDQTVIPLNEKVLYPISTANLTNFFASTFQNPAGINLNYAECSDRVGDFALTGTFYLKGSRTPLKIYLQKNAMYLTSDPQLLACLRLAYIFNREDGTRLTYIFNLDDMGDTSGVASKKTTAEEGVVVAPGTGGLPWSYTADPSLSINAYTMNYDDGNPVILEGAQPLLTANANEIITVQYFIYMEGCDPNCFEEAQLNSSAMRLAFSAMDQEG